MQYLLWRNHHKISISVLKKKFRERNFFPKTKSIVNQGLAFEMRLEKDFVPMFNYMAAVWE